MRKRSPQTHGFTLIELMTALSIFAIVVTVSLGSILGIFEANRKSRSLKAVMTNLNLAMESMSKEMRYGKNYHCGTSGTETNAQDCISGNSFLSFLSSDNVQVAYRLNGSSLERRENGGTFTAVTAPEVGLDSFVFYAFGTSPDDGYQPKILVYIKGHGGTGKSRSDFIFQTLISQRSLDTSDI